VYRTLGKLALLGASGLTCWGVYRMTRRYGNALMRIERLERKLKRARRAARRQTSEPLVREARNSVSRLSSRPEVLDFELPDLSGGRISLAQFRGWPVLLIFMDPRCPYSRAMLPDLVALQSELNFDDPTPLLISAGDPDENRRLVSEHSIRWPIALQHERELARLCGATATPTGYLVDSEGRLASPLAVGRDELLALARSASKRAANGAGASPNGVDWGPRGVTVWMQANSPTGAT
jgi:peroxiredoxin